ncbi:RNA recognition motif domain-containing protein [Ditylenchus destructor]|uniref:RNA recognition motif domain-containing protein n=1 Tax=Ditylenchus destructor TaxID=166010 RepID=A0AAD4MV31_9BILA|nr:RNA recognition motif domain-containing protein [Ditylenchus destructor]
MSLRWNASECILLWKGNNPNNVALRSLANSSFRLVIRTITGCSLAQNIKTGLSKNFGFVEFESILEAERTCELGPHVIDGQGVRVALRKHSELQHKFRLFVGGLSKQTSVETLREYFSKFGQIVDCAIPRNVDNSSRGFAFVIFRSQESIDNVLKSAPHIIDDATVDVKQTHARRRELTLFVGKLSPNTNNESLRAFYSK